MFWNGSTAIDGLSGNANAGAESCLPLLPAEFDTIDAHWSRNILQALLADIIECHFELVAYLSVGVVGDADATRIGNAFEARCDVHPIAKNIVVLNDDVPDIDADAQLDALVLRHGGIAFDHAPLDVDRTTGGIDRAGEFDQHAIACALDDAASVLCDLGVKEFAPMRVESH